jgi:hypothetical protein
MIILASKSAFSSHCIERESLECQRGMEDAKIPISSYLFMGASVGDVAGVDEHVASGKMRRCVVRV